MRIILLMNLLLFSFQPSWGAVENGKCLVPYVPLRWHMAYCMAKAETDDVQGVLESACAKEKVPKKIHSVCDQNLYWKTKWCTAWGELRKGKSIDQCVKDRKMIPMGVGDGF